MSLATRIKKFRVEKKESLQQLADAVGTSKGYIWELETGKSQNPSGDILNNLADHFGCTVDFLLGRSKELEPSESVLVHFRDFKELDQADQRTIQVLTEQLKKKKA